MIEIVNKSNHIPTNNDFYIGRGSALGNPYTHIKDGSTLAKYVVGTRKEAIKKYKEYLENEIISGNTGIINSLRDIYNKSNDETVYLVCYCVPKPCHGEVIREVIDNMEFDVIWK